MTFTAGQIVTADDLNALIPLLAVKTANESVTSSTALQNDNDLLIAMAANSTYVLDAMIFYTAGVAGDLKIAYTWPTGATGYWGGAGYDTTGGNTVRFVSVIAGASDTSLNFEGSTEAHVLVNGLFIVGSTAGNLQFRFAQVASSGTATTVLAGSWMRLSKVP